jgi:hypothetical protein
MLKNFPTRVLGVANKIIRTVPKVGISAQKLGNGVDASKTKIENAISNIPMIPAISATIEEANLKE